MMASISRSEWACDGKNSATSRVLFGVQRKLVAATDYLSGRAPVSEPSQLLDWDWLLLAPVHNVPLPFAKPGAGRITIKPKANIFSSDAQALYRLARAGAGLAIVPEFLATDDVASGRISYVLPDWALNQIDVFAVWPSNAPKNGLIRLMLEELSRRRLEIR